MQTRVRPPLQVWAGIECTVNRVGDTYTDQLERSGHATRPADLDLFARLGIKTVRYPILWERTAPRGVEHADWSWADERLGRLRELGIRPIVGLVHHGSGPRHTSLIEPSFAAGLAEFAGAVAARYPWVDSYTPVNEPLTTARFSGLYGHWYPHGRDDLTFARALLTQCRAVVLAMRAIRAVNPAAQLVQTDDLGMTFSTPALAYQADFENDRRWLTFDLLCGRLRPDHLLWHRLRSSGIDQAELEWFLDNPCPPDIIGLNHYLSGERFLDERLDRYPREAHGGNGRHAYADVLAARVRADGPAGPRVLLGQAWERYRRPIAVTEAHNGCTREEQMRWLLEVWTAAQDLRDAGADVRAVTVWSFLGAYDWDSLLTRSADHYEPGVFDLRAPGPRPTALAALAAALAAGHRPAHAVLETPGWWRRPERLWYPAVCADGTDAPRDTFSAARLDRSGSAARLDTSGSAARYGTSGSAARLSTPDTSGTSPRPLVITGAGGTLGRAFARICALRGLACHALTRHDLDIADEQAVGRLLAELRPWAVVNAAGYVRVDEAEREPQACRRANSEGPAVLAAACAAHGVALLTFSSDLVFDGAQSTPYVESNRVGPLGAYGASKAAAEARVLALLPGALVIRTGAFFGPWDSYNVVTCALQALMDLRRVVAANDVVVSPTYVPDLVHAGLDLLIDGECGVWHLANRAAVTWAELARRAAECAGIDPHGIVGRPLHSLHLAAPRPPYSALGSERGDLLPCLDDAIERYVTECDALQHVQRRGSPAMAAPFAVAS